MSADLPPILIADTPDTSRTFAVVADEARGFLWIAEVFDDDDAPIDGLSIVMPGGNGVLANIHAWGDWPTDSAGLNVLAARVAAALEEEEFRTDQRLQHGERDDDV
jgi:hypothetical protein